MCRNIDVQRMDEYIDEKDHEIREVYEYICSLEGDSSLEGDEILYCMNVKKLEPMKNEMSWNLYRGICFRVSCKERGEVEIEDGSITCLARLHAWILTFTDCLEGEERRGGLLQKLYEEI